MSPKINRVCLNCGKPYHWCSACGVTTESDAARDDGYCCKQCALEDDPTWKPSYWCLKDYEYK